jgi:hypothetical protein
VISKDPKKTIFLIKKHNATVRGIPFNLVFSTFNFPTHCPILGLELDYSRGKTKGVSRKSSPSFDRIDPTKGYIEGNVILISNFANQIKSDATPEQILAVGNYYKQLLTTINQ